MVVLTWYFNFQRIFFFCMFLYERNLPHSAFAINYLIKSNLKAIKKFLLFFLIPANKDKERWHNTGHRKIQILTPR